MRRASLVLAGLLLPLGAAAQTTTSSSADPLTELSALEARIDAIESRIVDAAGEVDLLTDTR